MYLEVKNIFFKYPQSKNFVIEDLSFSIGHGEIAAIGGPSGSGKTSILRILAGLEKLHSGSITVAEKLMCSNTMHLEPEQRGMGMVFQDLALFPHLTVAKNIAYGLFKKNKDEKESIIKDMLELISLPDYGDKYPHQLSGGQQQRVAIARALAPQPHLLLLDEPFSGLDAHLKSRIRTEIKEILKQASMTSIFVTHDQEDIDELADQVLRL